MCIIDSMSAGIQKNDTQQYCPLEDAAENGVFDTYSPTGESDWWNIKAEVNSPRDDDWSDDSEESQQTVLFGGNLDVENTPSTDGSFNLGSTSEDVTGRRKKKCKDSSAVNKPAQVVERRNARERRRVQAVNGAFQKLRKVVPIEDNKSKRMSKVKTLQLAIDYINRLQNQLQYNAQHSNDADLLVDLFTEFHPQQQVKMEPNDGYYRVPTYYLNGNNEN